MKFFTLFLAVFHFDSNAVFGAIALAINGVLAFLVARKIYSIYMLIKP